MELVAGAIYRSREEDELENDNAPSNQETCEEQNHEHLLDGMKAGEMKIFDKVYEMEELDHDSIGHLKNNFSENRHCSSSDDIYVDARKNGTLDEDQDIVEVSVLEFLGSLANYSGINVTISNTDDISPHLSNFTVDYDDHNDEEFQLREQEQIRNRPDPIGEAVYMMITDSDTGDFYEGPVINGIRHGDGAVLTQLDGSKFLGSYRHNYPVKGTYVTPSFTYTGTILYTPRLSQSVIQSTKPPRKDAINNNNSLTFHGSGILAQCNNRIYEGEFFRNKHHGVGKEITERKHGKKEIYTGDWDDGMRQGIGTLMIIAECECTDFVTSDFEGEKLDPHVNDDHYLNDSKIHENEAQDNIPGEYFSLIKNFDGIESSLNEQDVFVNERSSNENSTSELHDNEAEKQKKRNLCSSSIIAQLEKANLDEEAVSHVLSKVDCISGFTKKSPASGALSVKTTKALYSYSGVFARNCKHGEGTEVLADKSSYVGQFQNDKRHGQGQLTSANGTVKEGLWRCDMPQDGHWTISYPNGNKYNGECVRSLPHGRGMIIYPPTEGPILSFAINNDDFKRGKEIRGDLGGSVYTGQFRNGVRHGEGLCVYENGEQYHGKWVEDEPAPPPKTGNDEVGSSGLVEIFSIDGGYKGRDPNPKSSLETGYNKSNQGIFEMLQSSSEQDSVDFSESQNSLTTSTSNSKLHRYPNGDSFRGVLDSDNLRQFHGEYHSYLTNTTYDGYFVDNLRHGHGTLLTPTAKYIGHFEKDVREGDGTLILNDASTYTGIFHEGQFHGRGSLCENDGRIYVGEWKYGYKDGMGEERNADGTVYEGEFRNGKRCGVGILKKGDFVVYSGQWLDGLMHGEGVLHMRNDDEEEEKEKINIEENDSGIQFSHTLDSPSDESKTERACTTEMVEYKGMFLRGQKSGRGTLLTHPDGISMKGPWLRDIPVDGEWTITYSDDSAFSGFATCGSNIIDDGLNIHDGSDTNINFNFTKFVPIPNGFGTLKYSNGDLYTGFAFDGKREGKGLCVFANGDQWDGEWTDDTIDRNGSGILTLADGTSHKFGIDAD